MQAIILAAGMGKRLKELTENNTKCMVEINGVTLIDRMLNQIQKYNISRVVIVVGYKGQELMDYIDSLGLSLSIEYITNPIYERTNNIYSLALAKDRLCEDDTLLFESDLILEDSIIETLLSDPRDTLALVDKYEAWMDGTCVKLSDEDRIEAFVPKKSFNYDDIDKYYKTVNVYKFGKDFSRKCYVPFLEAYQTALGENEYYEQVLRIITMLDEPEIRAKRLQGQLWYEIDDIQDLDIATSMFIPDEDKRVELLSGRYGGYWRYPQLLDFCYLVNPFFPPKRLMDEIKSSFEILLTQYPSGMRVNSLLAGKNFGVRAENIVIGNGAAELIKILMDDMTGLTGVVRPTFEEYSHRYTEDEIIAFWPENDNYSYTVDELIEFFSDKSIKNLILINPDNPSGNYIERKDLIRLIAWTKEMGIQLVVDESFVDFADEKNPSLIDQKLLNENVHMYVVKSISKSYGVPGLRLGVLASGNKAAIADMKKEVSIWNINSFGEFYMQIAEKYSKDYEEALEKFRTERQRYVEALTTIDGLRIIPSQANYVMAEVTTGMTAKELNRRLIVGHNILIKNLVAKLKSDGRQYVRLAIRNTEENDRLVNALKIELGNV